MEIKLTTDNELEAKSLFKCINNPTKCTIETETYLLDGEIMLEEISEDKCVYRADLKYRFYGKTAISVKGKKRTGPLGVRKTYPCPPRHWLQDKQG